MSDAIEVVREFENAYYEGLSDEIRASIENRDKGLEMIRKGQEKAGLNLLEAAVGIYDGVEWREPLSPDATEERERFATLSVYARGHARAGHVLTAFEAAYYASRRVPEVPEHLRAYRILDQYVPILLGRNAAILAQTAHDTRVLDLASRSAWRARAAAFYSESPEHALFINDKMGATRRWVVRQRHGFIARAALTVPRAPTKALRAGIVRSTL